MFSQHSGASSAQLQRAGRHRKRSLNGSHFSHQLLTTNAFLRFSQEYNYISKEAIKVHAEAEASKLETVRNVLRLSAASVFGSDPKNET